MMNTQQTHHQIIDHLEKLPVIPSIARKILALKITTEEGERALYALIQKDPIILSKIIGLANSPLFGTGRKVLTLHDAASVLGTKRVKMSALSLAMMSSLKRKSLGLLNVDTLWQHSLSIAMTMESIARLMPEEFRPSEEEVYLAGLLHDIGFLVLDFIDPQLSDKFHARLAAEPECSLAEIEDEMLEMNHCELGAELARHWNLPEPIVTVLRYHHAPNDPLAESVHPLIAMLYLAGKLLSNLGFGDSAPVEVSVEEWQALEIDPMKGEEMKAKVQEHVKNVAEMNA